MTIGERIKELRESSGEMQVQTASGSGCSPQVLSNIERGCSKPPLDLLCGLADHFRTTTDYILGRSDIRWRSELPAAMNGDEADLLSGFRKMDKHQRRILLGKMEELLSE